VAKYLIDGRKAARLVAQPGVLFSVSQASQTRSLAGDGSWASRGFDALR